jgi:glycosyltransferase
LKVSIITVCYCSASTIADTLSSIAAQSHPDIEHIIVDGGSADNTMKIVDSFPHVTKKISKKDQGIYHAMNKGIEMATGDVVGILNADDIYAHKDILQKIAILFEDESIDAVYGDLIFVDQQDTSRVKRRWKSGPYQIEQFYKGWMPPHPTFFVRRAIYEKFGKFNTSLSSSADYELMLRFLLKHKIKPAYLNEVMINMRQGGKSTASFRNRFIAQVEDRMAWKINQLKPDLFTLILKPLSKIKQFINYE